MFGIRESKYPFRYLNKEGRLKEKYKAWQFDSQDHAEITCRSYRLKLSKKLEVVHLHKKGKPPICLKK